MLFLSAFTSYAQVDSLRVCLKASEGHEKLAILDKLIAADTSPGYRSYYAQAMSLAHSLRDTTGEIYTLSAMGDHFYDDAIQADSAPFYYEKALSLSKKTGLPHEIIRALEKTAAGYENISRFDRALTLYTEALSMSRGSADPKEITGALENLGAFYFYQHNDSAALDCFRQQLDLVEMLADSLEIPVCLNNIGLVYYSRGDYSRCIQYYQRSLSIEKRQNRTDAISQSLTNIGIAYKNLGMFDLALKNLLAALRYFEKIPASPDLATCYNTIGLVQMELNETDKALYYFFQALSIRQKLNYKRGIAGSLTNIGEAYMKKGEYNLSLDFLDRSVNLKRKQGDKALLASSLDLQGRVYFLKGDFTKSDSLYRDALALATEADAPKEKATTLNNLGELYAAWKKYDQAILRLDEGREIADTIGAKALLLKNYEITIKAFREKGDAGKALFFSDKYIALKNEILNEQKNRSITELQIKYETEKKEQEISLMHEKEKGQAAVLAQKNTLIYSLAGGAVLLIILVLVSLKAYRTGLKANKQNQVIIAQKQMLIEQKQNLMKELHHRVKNNLQVLSSLLGLQQQRLGDPSTKEAIKAVDRRLNAMLLIHQDLYGESAGSEVNMRDYIRKLADNLLYSFGYSSENFRLNLSADDLMLDADKALNIGFVCNEMISNACKHAFSKTAHPELNIFFRREKDSLHFTFADNGSGIADKDALEKTNSFGFRLIQMFIKDLQGTISISSGENGSSFEFTVPLNTRS